MGLLGTGQAVREQGCRKAELHGAGLLSSLPSQTVCAFTFVGETECKPNACGSSFADGCPIPRKVDNSLYCWGRGCSLLLRNVPWCLQQRVGEEECCAPLACHCTAYGFAL